MVAATLHDGGTERARLVESARAALVEAGYRAWSATHASGEAYAVEVPYPALPEVTVVLHCERVGGRWVFRQTARDPICAADDVTALVAWVRDLVAPYGHTS